MSIMDDDIAAIFDVKMANDVDYILQILANNQMNPSTNEEDQRCIQQIMMDLINSSKEYSTSKNLSQENADGTNNMERQEQIQQINNDNSSTDIASLEKEPEQISSDGNITTNDEQHLDNINEHSDADPGQDDQVSSPFTTGEQQMNALEYCRQLLEKLTLAVNTMESTLVNWVIPAKTGDSYLKNLPIPLLNKINATTHNPLNKLSHLLQTGTDTLSSFRPICNTDNATHTDPIGEESNETSDKVTSAPSEHCENRLNQDIQAPTQSELPKDPDSAALSLSLSQLLAQAKTIIQELTLAKLCITEQPKQLWRKRTINCLKKKWCTAIQGRSGKQRHYIGIKWSKLTNCNQCNLFILVQLLSHDNHPHPSNVLVPKGTRVKKSKSSKKGKKRSILKDLIIKNEYGCDTKCRTILCPITATEYRQCTKNLQVIMFSLYKTSEEMANTDDVEDSSNNEEVDETEEDSSVEDELCKLSKLRICLCRRTANGELEYVTNCVDTELIEESKGTEPLAIAKVTPEYLCQCGNETITVTLNTNSEKNGFVVRLNGVKENIQDIRGVTKKQLFFNSRPKTISRENFLKIKISKKSIYKTIKRNVNPYNGLLEKRLLNMKINYVEHSDNPHEHKDTNTGLSIQLIEIDQTEPLF